MIAGRNTKLPSTKPIVAEEMQRGASTRLCRIASRYFAGEAVREAVVTRIHFKTSPEEVWENMVFFEEIPGDPPILLRALLPQPVRTIGDKTRSGSSVRCEYTKGELVKRITRVDAPRSLHFEIVNQRLGIEECIETLGGSYQIRACGEGTEVELTTNYKAYLRPRFLWRRLEAFLIGQLHRHIVRGLDHAIQKEHSPANIVVANSPSGPRISGGGLACTVPPSCSRRSS